MEHTPIPWKKSDSGLPTDPLGWDIWGEQLVACATNEANAEFIVRAANNHAKLLAALEGRGCEVDPTDPCFSDVLSPPVQGPHMKACPSCDAIREANK